MITIKNIRPGILVIPDAGLKLRPGQVVEVAVLSKQGEQLMACGHLVRLGNAPPMNDPARENDEASDLSKLSASQAIAKVAEMEDPEHIKAAIDSEKRRSVLDALTKKREEISGGAE